MMQVVIMIQTEKTYFIIRLKLTQKIKRIISIKNCKKLKNMNIWIKIISFGMNYVMIKQLHY